jgi:DNA repair exonuclease SbcCD ATPase subunit
VKIVSMRVENFLSFGEAEFDFDDVGLVLVEGDNRDDDSASSNGSGKSALIDALIWCLYGTTLRGYEKDEVVHRKVSKDCVVRVRMTPSDGSVMYEVKRARKHTKLKNSLTVDETNRGGETTDVSKPSNDETQEVVDRLLGCTRSTFLSSVVFGQDRAYRFSSLTDGEQKKILDDVLGVERFAQACAAARSQLGKLAFDLAHARAGLERAQAFRDEAELDAADLEAKDVDFVASQRKKIEAEKEKLKIAADWVRKNAKVDVVKLKKVLDAFQHAVTMYERKLAKVSDADAAAQAASAAAKARRDDLAEHLKRNESLTGNCPTCGQRVDAKGRAKVVAELREKLKSAQAKCEEADASSGGAATALGIAKVKLKEARAASTDAQVTFNKGVGVSVDAAAWRRRAVDHEERVAELGREVSPYAALAEKARARRLKHDAEVDRLGEQISKLVEHEREAEFWVKAFGARGLRSLLIDSSLPLLNQEASRVSRAITGGSIEVEFSATSEQKSGKVVDRFEVRVDNRHGAGDYRGNSSGERAKVDLCVGLALQRLVASRSSASFNVAFYDEVFDHLDTAAHERVIEVLSELDTESVFVVSHNEDLRAFFPNVITIKKSKGFSSVER